MKMKIFIIGLPQFIKEASATFSSYSKSDIASIDLTRDDHKGFVGALEQVKKGKAVCLIQADLDSYDLTRTRYLEVFSGAFRVVLLALTQRTRPDVKFFAMGTGDQLKSLGGVFDIFCS